jgi:hypothetical protein
MDDHNDGACAEGSDLPVESPLRAVLFGKQFAGIATDGIPSISATGPYAVQMLAQQLLNAGFSGDRELILHRGGIPVATTTIAKAAHNGDCCNE